MSISRKILLKKSPIKFILLYHILGEATFREREEDVRVLRIEVKRLRQEEASLQKTAQNMEEMKKEVLQLQKDLLQEKTKVKSLQSELENPLNM